MHTDAKGIARLELPEFDGVTDIHRRYQMVVRFKADHKYPELKAAELPQLEFYANSRIDP